MAVAALLYRQSNKVKNIKNLISIQINEYRVTRPGTILININRYSNIIQRKQIRSFSLTEPRFANNANYASHWKFEKYLSAALLGIYPAAFIAPSLPLDYILIITSVVHFHMGLESVVADYIRPITFGKTFPKIAQGMLLISSISIIVGLIHFTRNDVGVVKAFQQFWAIKGFEGESDEKKNKRNGCPPDEKDEKDKKTK